MMARFEAGLKFFVYNRLIMAKNPLSRRDFIILAGLGGAGATLAGCMPVSPERSPTPTPRNESLGNPNELLGPIRMSIDYSVSVGSDGNPSGKGILSFLQADMPDGVCESTGVVCRSGDVRVQTEIVLPTSYTDGTCGYIKVGSQRSLDFDPNGYYLAEFLGFTPGISGRFITGAVSIELNETEQDGSPKYSRRVLLIPVNDGSSVNDTTIAMRLNSVEWMIATQLELEYGSKSDSPLGIALALDTNGVPVFAVHEFFGAAPDIGDARSETIDLGGLAYTVYPGSISFVPDSTKDMFDPAKSSVPLYEALDRSRSPLSSLEQSCATYYLYLRLKNLTGLSG